MIWKNDSQSRTDLFLIIGLVLIIEGFIGFFRLSNSTIFVSGVLVFLIGAYRALKLLRENGGKIWRKERRRKLK